MRFNPFRAKAIPEAPETVIYHGCEISIIPPETSGGSITLKRITEGSAAKETLWELCKLLAHRMDLGLPEGPMILTERGNERGNAIIGNTDVIWAHDTNVATVTAAVRKLAAEPKKMPETAFYYGYEVTITPPEKDGDPVTIARAKPKTILDSIDLFGILFARLRDRMDIGLPEGQVIEGERGNKISSDGNVIWARDTDVATVVAAIQKLAAEPLIEIKPQASEPGPKAGALKSARASESQAPGINFGALGQYLTKKGITGVPHGNIVTAIREAEKGKQDLKEAVDALGLDERTLRKVTGALDAATKSQKAR